jgi:SAM-dependent methyltransferase
MAKVIEQTNSNALAHEDYSVHAWYRFVLSFPPHLVRKYLSLFDLQQKGIVFDPFCGTGTTLVEAQKKGFRSIGADAHPFAAFVSRVKTNWSISLYELETKRNEVISLAFEEYEKLGLGSLSLSPLLLREDQAAYSEDTELSEDEKKLIPTGFLSPLPLKRLLLLRSAIGKVCHRGSEDTQDFFYLALCYVIANGAGNFAFGPEIYRTKPKEDYDVLGHFAKQTRIMIQDLKMIGESHRSYKKAEIFCSDSRNCAFLQERIDAVITSPPYPNEKDYTRTTRVESVLLGMIRKKDELRELKNWLLRSNTRNVFVSDTDKDEIREFESINKICQQIEERRIVLGKTSGFEKLYHKVVAHYFGGMRKHLRTLRPHLRYGAKLAYVVGDQLSFLMVPVYTAQLLGEIAVAEKYKVLGIDLWRERVGTKVRNSKNGEKSVRIREEVLILEKAK